MGDIINAGADLLGFGPASKQADATRAAANIGAESAAQSLAFSREAFNKQMELQDPFRQGGLTAQNKLMEALGIGGDVNAAGYGRYGRDFSAADFQQDPGYAFRLSEGMKQLGSQARARGGAVGGRTMMAGQQYAQDLASQEYQGAFNRYQTNRANQLAPLGSLMSSGQAAASNQAGSAGQYGVNAGNTAMIGGANQANAMLMGGNIAAQQFGNYGKGLNQMQSMYGDKIANFFTPAPSGWESILGGTRGSGD
jgi:hypothetical protein